MLRRYPNFANTHAVAYALLCALLGSANGGCSGDDKSTEKAAGNAESQDGDVDAGTSAASDDSGQQGDALTDAARMAPESGADGGDSARATPAMGMTSPLDAGVVQESRRFVGPAQLTVIAEEELSRPSDLEFNPLVNDELWVVNHADASTLIIHDASSDARSAERRLDVEAARHFMPRPTGIAFGGRATTIVDAAGMPVEGTFATCPEAEADFMGPTLWTSDLRIFAISKSQRQPPFNGSDTGKEGPGSHIDMLHRTPSCTGVAYAGTGNQYWTYSGTREQLVKYDFAEDHGIGNTYHGDGSVWRYAVSGIRYVKDIPSHLAFSATSGLVYLVDSGNARILSFDPKSATVETPMSDSDNVDAVEVALDLSGGQLVELVASDYGLALPSGLELYEDRIYVTDNATSTVHVFALDGEPLWQAPLPEVQAGGLAGISFGPDDKLYLVDMIDNRILRLENAI